MNPVIHFEMPYDDRARMAAFYQSAFGWKFEMLGPEMGDYAVATTHEPAAPVTLKTTGHPRRGSTVAFFSASPTGPVSSRWSWSLSRAWRPQSPE